jgi:hypothetical protein
VKVYDWQSMLKSSYKKVNSNLSLFKNYEFRINKKFNYVEYHKYNDSN